MFHKLVRAAVVVTLLVVAVREAAMRIPNQLMATESAVSRRVTLEAALNHRCLSSSTLPFGLWQPCSRNNVGLSCRLSRRLCLELAGQTSVHRLLPTIVEHMKEHKAPFTVFFGGDSGTGKSSSAYRLAQELLSGRDEHGSPNGLYKVDGWRYQGKLDGESLAALKEQFFDEVLTQLARCAGSVIVFDELHMAHPEIVRVLHRFSQRSFIEHKGVKVDVSHAVFVLITDFGREGLSHLMSESEMVAYLQTMIETIYGDATLVDAIVPFSPLDMNDLLNVAIINLLKMSDHETLKERGITNVFFEESVPTLLIDFILEGPSARRLRYGRAVETALKDKILTPLFREVPQPKKSSWLSLPWQGSSRFGKAVEIRVKPGVDWNDESPFTFSVVSTPEPALVRVREELSIALLSKCLARLDGNWRSDTYHDDL